MYDAANSALNAWWIYKASTRTPVVYRLDPDNGLYSVFDILKFENDLKLNADILVLSNASAYYRQLFWFIQLG